MSLWFDWYVSKNYKKTLKTERVIEKKTFLSVFTFPKPKSSSLLPRRLRSEIAIYYRSYIIFLNKMYFRYISHINVYGSISSSMQKLN